MPLVRPRRHRGRIGPTPPVLSTVLSPTRLRATGHDQPGEAGAALPADAIVLSADDAADLSDRVYQVRCAAEDVATALDEGAGATELRELCDVLLRAARAADGWRRVGV